jgi:hypothetical protein
LKCLGVKCLGLKWGCLCRGLRGGRGKAVGERQRQEGSKLKVFSTTAK